MWNGSAVMWNGFDGLLNGSIARPVYSIAGSLRGPLELLRRRGLCGLYLGGLHVRLGMGGERDGAARAWLDMGFLRGLLRGGLVGDSRVLLTALGTLKRRRVGGEVASWLRRSDIGGRRGGDDGTKLGVVHGKKPGGVDGDGRTGLLDLGAVSRPGGVEGFEDLLAEDVFRVCFLDTPLVDLPADDACRVFLLEGDLVAKAKMAVAFALRGGFWRTMMEVSGDSPREEYTLGVPIGFGILVP